MLYRKSILPFFLLMVVGVKLISSDEMDRQIEEEFEGVMDQDEPVIVRCGLMCKLKKAFMHMENFAVDYMAALRARAALIAYRARLSGGFQESPQSSNTENSGGDNDKETDIDGYEKPDDDDDDDDDKDDGDK